MTNKSKVEAALRNKNLQATALVQRIADDRCAE